MGISLSCCFRKSTNEYCAELKYSLSRPQRRGGNRLADGGGECTMVSKRSMRSESCKARSLTVRRVVNLAPNTDHEFAGSGRAWLNSIAHPRGRP